MIKRLILCMFLTAILAVSGVRAQASSKPATTSDPDEIFNSIMQTIPPEMKARIDSAKTQRYHNEVAGMDIKAQPENRTLNEKSYMNGIEKLPDDIREQVRKTIKELEREKVERTMEFKETLKQKDSK